MQDMATTPAPVEFRFQGKRYTMRRTDFKTWKLYDDAGATAGIIPTEAQFWEYSLNVVSPAQESDAIVGALMLLEEHCTHQDRLAKVNSRIVKSLGEAGIAALHRAPVDVLESLAEVLDAKPWNNGQGLVSKTASLLRKAVGNGEQEKPEDQFTSGGGSNAV